jgi:hypothetical protein
LALIVPGLLYQDYVYLPIVKESPLPVVEQLYCGYCVKAMALSKPSLSISSIASSVKGWTYRNPI